MWELVCDRGRDSQGWGHCAWSPAQLLHFAGLLVPLLGDALLGPCQVGGFVKIL
jgi:hypothetical protein